MRKEKVENIVSEKGGRIIGEIFGGYRSRLFLECSNGHTWDAEARKIKEGSWCKGCFFDKIRKYDVDHNFFSRDTEESFYWAGFIAADGWVRSDSKLAYVFT